MKRPITKPSTPCSTKCLIFSSRPLLMAINKGLEENIKHLVEHGVDGLVIGRFIDEPESLNAYLTKHKVPYVVLDQSEDNGFTARHHPVYVDPYFA